jgi:uncharacterized membrane protein YhaH (DUF805 family)
MVSGLPPVQLSPGIGWLLLSPIGRVSRKVYWYGLAFNWVIIALAANMWVKSLPGDVDLGALTFGDFMGSNPLFPVLFVVVTWFEMALLIKRLQDVGLPGFLAFLAFVPVLNFLGVLTLGFLPSAQGPNRYGPQPDSYYRRR